MFCDFYIQGMYFYTAYCFEKTPCHVKLIYIKILKLEYMILESRK